MGIQRRCLACGAEFTVAQDLAAALVRCPKCGKPVPRPASGPRKPPAAQPPEPPPTESDNLGELLGLDSPGGRSSQSQRSRYSTARKRQNNAWIWPAGIAAVVLIVCAGGVAAVLSSRAGGKSAAAKTETAGKTKAGASKTEAAAEDDQFAIVAPPKFVTPNFDSPSPESAAEAAEPAGPDCFDGWGQDFEKAKQTAAAENKSILVFFTGSDWCGFCKRLKAEVFGQPGFDAQASKDFVLVYLDYPHGPAASAKVKNAAQNAAMQRQFQVRGFPVVILTDAKGRVFAELGGYRPGGLDSYVAELNRLKADGEKLRQALDSIDSAPSAEAKNQAVEQAVQIIQSRGLEKFYADAMKQWKGEA